MIQKKAIRIVTNQGSRDHTNKVFIKLQTLKFKEFQNTTNYVESEK